MNIFKAIDNTKQHTKLLTGLALSASLLMVQGCAESKDGDDSVVSSDELVIKEFSLQLGSDLNNGDHPLLSANPGGPGGSTNQSLRAGDILQGDTDDDLLIGGLGVDILVGGAGDDILIGGTEDFNSSVDGDDRGSDNRDRAFGQAGDDVFVWAPGDGSDFFDGGDGTDVIIFGILGELRDADGSTDGAPFFNVNPAGEGSQDFDGIFLDANGHPQVQVSSGPGFCSFVNAAAYPEEFTALNLDQIVRFSIRGIANAFDAGERTDDDGLRVAVSLKDTEYLVCTERDFDADNGLDNIQVLDLTSGVPVVASIDDLPEFVQTLIQ